MTPVNEPPDSLTAREGEGGAKELKTQIDAEEQKEGVCQVSKLQNNSQRSKGNPGN